MILLSFSVMKWDAINFIKNLIFYIHLWFLLTKNTLTIHCHFLMYCLKILTKSFLLQFIENPHLQDSIFTGIHFNQRGKLILLAVLFTELLKFALLKSSQVSKIKISCDRMDTQKKPFFLK